MGKHYTNVEKVQIFLYYSSIIDCTCNNGGKYEEEHSGTIFYAYLFYITILSLGVQI